LPLGPLDDARNLKPAARIMNVIERIREQTVQHFVFNFDFMPVPLRVCGRRFGRSMAFQVIAEHRRVAAGAIHAVQQMASNKVE
jgi:hypothetical protein